MMVRAGEAGDEVTLAVCGYACAVAIGKVLPINAQ
jgi:hypothetical protein